MGSNMKNRRKRCMCKNPADLIIHNLIKFLREQKHFLHKTGRKTSPDFLAITHIRVTLDPTKHNYKDVHVGPFHIKMTQTESRGGI